MRSKDKYSIPVTLAGIKLNIHIDVVESDIALLLSKKAMKKVAMQIDI